MNTAILVKSKTAVVNVNVVVEPSPVNVCVTPDCNFTSSSTYSDKVEIYSDKV